MLEAEERSVAACCYVVTTCLNKMAAETEQGEDREPGVPIFCFPTATDDLRGLKVKQLSSSFHQ